MLRIENLHVDKIRITRMRLAYACVAALLETLSAWKYRSPSYGAHGRASEANALSVTIWINRKFLYAQPSVQSYKSVVKKIIIRQNPRVRRPSVC